MTKVLRIIFAGTPDFAACHLNILIQANYHILGVFTQPDRPAGRGHKLKSSSVKKLALKYNLPIFQPLSLHNTESYKIIANLKADLIIVVAYGLLLPKKILDMPKFGCINVHGSLLPRWRGAAPIQRALLAGDKYTGITIIQMDTGLDTGPILYKTKCEIKSYDTTLTLYTKLICLGQDALLTTLKLIITGSLKLIRQNETNATYANKLSKKEAKLNWYLPAKKLVQCIHAFNPWPISYFILDQHYIKVFEAHVSIQSTISYSPGTILAVNDSGIYIATYSNVLTLTLLQLAGKKIMSVLELINARQHWFIPGMILN